MWTRVRRRVALAAAAAVVVASIGLECARGGLPQCVGGAHGIAAITPVLSFTSTFTV